jgi:hypothetical protein
MPLFGHSKQKDEATNEAAPESPDSDALLEHFRELPLAQRAAEVLKGALFAAPAGRAERHGQAF